VRSFTINDNNNNYLLPFCINCDVLFPARATQEAPAQVCTGFVVLYSLAWLLNTCLFPPWPVYNLVPYDMKFSWHVYFAILRCDISRHLHVSSTTLQKFVFWITSTLHFWLTQFISLAMLLWHPLEFIKLTLSKVQ